MTSVLHIDCSPPHAGAVTRRLADRFVAAWRSAGAGRSVVKRDLGAQPPPHVGSAFVQAIGSPSAEHTEAMREALQYADELTQEFLGAQRYVIAVPMRILTVPSSFKAYVEHVFHEGRVFKVTEAGYVGLLEGRKVLCVTARGGDYRPGSAIRRFDMLEPYLRGLFEFCGVAADQIDVVNVNATFDERERARSIAAAEAVLQETASRW